MPNHLYMQAKAHARYEHESLWVIEATHLMMSLSPTLQDAPFSSNTFRPCRHPSRLRVAEFPVKLVPMPKSVLRILAMSCLNCKSSQIMN